MNPTNSADLFARLLATENITVRRQVADTASFDTETRVLTLPAFANDMPDTVSVLFTSHEVGHAIHTPKLDVMAKIKSRIEPSQNREAHNRLHKIFNIVEDARIEKLIKREYPGLKRDYFAAYEHLVEKGFLGKQDEISTYSFLDRLNIFFKAGVSMSVPFSTAEQKIVDKVSVLESFDDVVEVVELLYTPVDEDSDGESGDGESGDGESGESSDESSGEESSDGEVVEVACGDGESGESSDESSGEESSDGESGDGEESSDSESSDGESGDGESGDGDGESGDGESGDGEDSGESSAGGVGDSGEIDTSGEITTASSIEDAMRSMSDTSNDKPFSNCEIKFRKGYKDCIENDKGVRYSRTRYLNKLNAASRYDVHVSGYQSFLREVKPMVSAMAQSFKRNQAAAEYRKTRTAKTGVIDTNRLHNYKVSEDIFRRAKQVQKGKSHGLVFFLDFSHSMSYGIHSAAKQIILLAQFCKSIRVPFDVYAFTTGRARFDGANGKIDGSGSPVAKGYAAIDPRMIPVLSSSMKNAEYIESLEFLFGYTRDIDQCESSSVVYTRPEGGVFGMGGTPIGQVLEITNELISDFKKNNRVDIVTVVMFTDGEDSASVHQNIHNRFFTSSSITGKSYNVPYGNALIQDIRKANGIKFINMHMTDSFTLPMDSDNTTGESFGYDELRTLRRKHGADKISEFPNRGGFNTTYVVGRKALGLSKESRQFVKRLAENFATDSADWK